MDAVSLCGWSSSVLLGSLYLFRLAHHHKLYPQPRLAERLVQGYGHLVVGVAGSTCYTLYNASLLLNHQSIKSFQRRYHALPEVYSYDLIYAITASFVSVAWAGFYLTRTCARLAPADIPVAQRITILLLVLMVGIVYHFIAQAARPLEALGCMASLSNAFGYFVQGVHLFDTLELEPAFSFGPVYGLLGAEVLGHSLGILSLVPRTNSPLLWGLQGNLPKASLSMVGIIAPVLLALFLQCHTQLWFRSTLRLGGSVSLAKGCTATSPAWKRFLPACDNTARINTAVPIGLSLDPSPFASPVSIETPTYPTPIVTELPSPFSPDKAARSLLPLKALSCPKGVLCKQPPPQRRFSFLSYFPTLHLPPQSCKQKRVSFGQSVTSYTTYGAVHSDVM